MLFRRTATSFKAELARFRAELAAEMHNLEPGCDKLLLEDEQHLARWAADDRAEEIWKTIQAQAIGPFPIRDNKWIEPLDHFVLSVLLVRKAAANIDDIRRRWEKKRARYRQLAIDAERLAQFYSNALIGAPSTRSREDQRIQLRAEIYKEDAEIMRKLAAKGPKSLRVSRIDRNGSRQRVAFMYAMSRFVTTFCGQPLDNIVAVLTDIAFPSCEATSLDQVRSARRDSTRIQRATPKKRSARKKAAISIS
jgi:hypothetical protein